MRQEPARYIKKKDYGKAPSYLEDRKAAMKQQQEDDKQAELERQEEENKLYHLLSETDRIKILAGLKVKWEKLNTDYQKLSLTVDTVPKINR